MVVLTDEQQGMALDMQLDDACRIARATYTRLCAAIRDGTPSAVCTALLAELNVAYACLLHYVPGEVAGFLRSLPCLNQPKEPAQIPESSSSS